MSQQKGQEGDKSVIKKTLEKLYAQTLNRDGDAGVLFLFSRKQAYVIK